MARRRREDRRVELAGEKVRDHRLLEERGAAREVLHVAEEVAHLQRGGPGAQERALLGADAIEPPALVLGVDSVRALLPRAVQERQLRLIEQLLKRRVDRERADRPRGAVPHVGRGEHGRPFLAPLLADSRERLERGSGLVVTRRLGRRLGARLHLLAPLRRAEHPLQRARRAEQLRRRQAVESKRRRPRRLRQPQEMQQIGADGRQRESAFGGARCALRVGHPLSISGKCDDIRHAVGANVNQVFVGFVCHHALKLHMPVVHDDVNGRQRSMTVAIADLWISIDGSELSSSNLIAHRGRREHVDPVDHAGHTFYSFHHVFGIRF